MSDWEALEDVTLLVGGRADGCYVRVDRFLNVIESHSADVECAVLAAIARTRELSASDPDVYGSPNVYLLAAVAEEAGLKPELEPMWEVSVTFAIHAVTHWQRAAKAEGVQDLEYQLNSLACMNSIYSLLEAAWFDVADFTLRNEPLAEDLSRQFSGLRKWEVLAHALSRQLPRDRETKALVKTVNEFLEHRNHLVHVPVRLKRKAPALSNPEALEPIWHFIPSPEDLGSWIKASTALTAAYSEALGGPPILSRTILSR